MARPELLPGETEIAAYRANRAQGRIARGGKLYLTDQRLIFLPHAIDRATLGKSWEIPLTSISDVTKTEREMSLFNGAMRHRLRVEAGGQTEIFLVNKLDEVIATIDRARTS